MKLGAAGVLLIAAIGSEAGRLLLLNDPEARVARVGLREAYAGERSLTAVVPAEGGLRLTLDNPRGEERQLLWTLARPAFDGGAALPVTFLPGANAGGVPGVRWVLGRCDLPIGRRGPPPASGEPGAFAAEFSRWVAPHIGTPSTATLQADGKEALARLQRGEKGWCSVVASAMEARGGELGIVARRVALLPGRREMLTDSHMAVEVYDPKLKAWEWCDPTLGFVGAALDGEPLSVRAVVQRAPDWGQVKFQTVEGGERAFSELPVARQVEMRQFYGRGIAEILPRLAIAATPRPHWAAFFAPAPEFSIIDREDEPRANAFAVRTWLREGAWTLLAAAVFAGVGRWLQARRRSSRVRGS